MIVSVMIVPRLNVNSKLSCYKEIVQGKMRPGTRQLRKYKTFRQDLPGFSVHAHTHSYIQNVNLFFCVLWKVVTVVNSRYM
jgi:hypothetical protein